MRIYFLVLIIILFTQCADKKSSSVENSENDKNNFIIENRFAEKIQEYYSDGEGSGLELKVNKTDSINELIFKDSDDFSLMRIEIPKKNISNSNKQILFVDFNNDGLQDVIINVYREGGWGGGNVYDTEILIFRNEETDYVLKSANNSKNLTDCNSGQFSLEGLENEKLFGTSYCYAPDDGHCCPSLEYKTTLIEEDWKLKHFMSELK